MTDRHESCASALIEAASDLIAIDRPHESCASALIEAASDLIAIDRSHKTVLSN